MRANPVIDATERQAVVTTPREKFLLADADLARLIENMWRMAYADAHLDVNENHVISKVAGLLYVTHGEYIAARMRAKEATHLA